MKRKGNENSVIIIIVINKNCRILSNKINDDFVKKLGIKKNICLFQPNHISKNHLCNSIIKSEGSYECKQEMKSLQISSINTATK